MPLLEILTLNVAASIAKSAAKVWLKDEGLVGASEGIIETFKRRFDDVLVCRSTQRIFDHVQDDVAQRLEFFVDREFPGLPANEREAAAYAVAELLSAYELTGTMFTANLDAVLLEREVLAEATRAFAMLSTSGEALARRLLNECCNYIVSIAGKLPDFQVAATRELLKRETAVREDLSRILDELSWMRSNTSTAEASRIAGFEDQYRRTLVQQLDRLQLFGLRLIGAGSRISGLSNTFVPLSAMSDGSSEASPVEQLLPLYTKVMIRGEAGLGKTTLMQWLAVQAAQHAFSGALSDWNGRVPFYMRLRDYAKPDSDLPRPDQLVAGAVKNLTPLMPPGWAHECLSTGSLVLIDGVDEIPADRRLQLLDWITDTTGMYPATIFIVSSRPAALDAEDPVPLNLHLRLIGFESITLEPMTLVDCEALVTRWHAAAARDFPDSETRHALETYERNLRRTIRSRAPIRNLASNPLLCSMMCALNWDRQEQLPDQRMELYRLALEMLLDRREEARSIAPVYGYRLERNTKEKLLDALAYWMLRNGYSEAPRDGAEFIIEGAATRFPQLGASPDILLNELLERSGVLRSPQHGTIDFIHRTFMEYMGARAAVSARDFGLLVEKAQAENWREVVVFAAGHALDRDRDTLVSELLRLSTPAVRSATTIGAQVTTVCCLETVGDNLDGLLMEALQKLTATLFPPRTFAAAQLLSPAAAQHPEWLKGHGDLGPEVVASCIRTAAIIATDPMLDVIEEYGEIEGELVDQEIVRAWHAFDEGEFERRVIRAREGLFGIAWSDLTPATFDCFKVLLFLKQRRIAANDLRTHLDAFERDHALRLPYNRSLIDAVLDTFSLETGDRMVGPELDLDSIRRIARLDSLRSVDLGPVEPGALAALQNMPCLEELLVTITRNGDLRALRRLQSLRALTIAGEGVEVLDVLKDCPIWKASPSPPRSGTVRSISWHRQLCFAI